MSSEQLNSDMSVVYLLIGCDGNVGGIITPDGFHVFSIYDFMQIVLIGGKSRKYVQNLWNDICRQNAQFMQVQGTLALAVPSKKRRNTPPTAGTTVVGLKGILDVLGNRVAEARRETVEGIFARYMIGDWSMLVDVNLNATVNPQIPRLSYNFQPPTASNAPVASIVVEEAGAGVEEPDLSSRESSTEFDFSSNSDHVVREQDSEEEEEGGN